MRTTGPREKREPGHEAGLRQPLKNLFRHVVNKKGFPYLAVLSLQRIWNSGFRFFFFLPPRVYQLLAVPESAVLGTGRGRQSKASYATPPFRFSASSLWWQFSVTLSWISQRSEIGNRANPWALGGIQLGEGVALLPPRPTVTEKATGSIQPAPYHWERPVWLTMRAWVNSLLYMSTCKATGIINHSRNYFSVCSW